MGFRIQPREIEIPEQDPFKNDLLGRQEPAEVLTQVLRSIEGPCVLAVDAQWGAGKTTFLNMLAQHLRNREFPVVEFNAWATDYTDDPFVALSEELTDGLRRHTTGPVPDEIDKVRKAAKEVLRRAVPGAIRLATAGLLNIDPLMEKEAGQVLASYAQKRLSDYLDTKTSLQTFRTSLEELANELAETNHGLPLVVVIDELDRCRPSYAVELLETAKHLFAVDRVAFVLAVNRSERVRLFFVEDFSPYSWALLPANASLQWPFRGGRHQAGQRVPASFRQPAEPRHGAEHLRSSPRQARSLLDIRAAFWYGAVGREADLRWL